MQSVKWKVLGKDNLAGVLRSDLKKAKKEVQILGQWIDDYFASIIIESCPKNVSLRIVSRPFNTMDDNFVKYATSAYDLFSKSHKTDFRFHSTIHAKVIIIDGVIAYCGSANWYRYSMEKSEEIVLRGPVEAIPDIIDEVASIWDQSTTEKYRLEETLLSQDVTGYNQELIDPIVSKKLKEVKGAFILGKKRKHNIEL